jgi:hypothetical protein
LFFTPAIISEVRVFVFEAEVLSEFGNPYPISVTLSRIHNFFCGDTKLFFSQEFCVFRRERERERERRKNDEQRTDLYVEGVCGDLGVDDVLFLFPTHA